MPTRKAHHKSRKGCLTCKRRHVKCDESGPPCGTCAARNTTCEYPSFQPRSQQQNVSSESVSREGGLADRDTPVNDAGAVKPANPDLGIPASTTPSPRIEVELMHRWSTSTYKSMCRTTESDRQACQVMIPQLALQHDFLLHSLFALSALDLAASEATPSHLVSKYVRVAIEYQTSSIRGFRDALADIKSAPVEALVYCSSMFLILCLMSSRFPDPGKDRPSVIEQLLVYVQMLKGATAVLETDLDIIKKSVLLQGFPELEDIPETALEASTAQAFQKVSQWNEARLDGSSFESRLQAMSTKIACQKGLFWLKECFTRCIKVDDQGHALGLLEMAGPGFVDAIRARDPVALVILTLWGLLFERAPKIFWWAHQIGELLLEEVTEILGPECDARAKETLEWVSEQIRQAHASRRDAAEDV